MAQVSLLHFVNIIKVCQTKDVLSLFKMTKIPIVDTHPISLAMSTVTSIYPLYCSPDTRDPFPICPETRGRGPVAHG